MTDKDELDLTEFACKNHEYITMVAISLVRTADNIETVRSKLRSVEGGDDMTMAGLNVSGRPAGGWQFSLLSEIEDEILTSCY